MGTAHQITHEVGGADLATADPFAEQVSNAHPAGFFRPYTRKTITIGILVLCLVPFVRADEWINPKANVPPKAAPQRQNAGEGVPPLPLPGTPLRRSEPKREPSPPALVGSVTFAPQSLPAGSVDWQTTIIDIEQWVQFTNANLGQRYRVVETDFSRFSYDPTELPILYFTGWKPLPHFDRATIERLRGFLLAGGTWVVHSNCGRPEFNDSFRAEIKRIFPDRELASIRADHPIYSSFYPIAEVKVRKDAEPWQTVAPRLETINIGTRAAVIFSPIDLSCGWDADAHPIVGGILYDMQDARRLGANIVTYSLAEYQYARVFDQAKVFHQQDAATQDQLVIGQIVHNGDWDPTPHGLPNLLKAIDRRTTLKVQFKRTTVDLETSDILGFPVLYLCGQRASFALSDVARKRLREYLDHGGTLIVDCAAGSSEFDEAFRKQIKLLYPDHALQPLQPEHPLFTFVEDCKSVSLAPMAAQLLGPKITPRLEAIQIDGTMPVAYSPLSLSAGWEQLPRAYNKGYADEDAIRLGVNVFAYTVSH